MFDADLSPIQDAARHLRVGDHVTIRRDVLAELGRDAAGLPPTWFCIPAGTPGRLIGWRDRDDDSRAIVDLEGTDRRVVVFVREGNVSYSRRESATQRQPVRPARRHRLRHRS